MTLSFGFTFWQWLFLTKLDIQSQNVWQQRKPCHILLLGIHVTFIDKGFLQSFNFSEIISFLERALKKQDRAYPPYYPTKILWYNGKPIYRVQVWLPTEANCRGLDRKMEIGKSGWSPPRENTFKVSSPI